jgi:hypothetical protein
MKYRFKYIAAIRLGSSRCGRASMWCGHLRRVRADAACEDETAPPRVVTLGQDLIAEALPLSRARF